MNRQWIRAAGLPLPLYLLLLALTWAAIQTGTVPEGLVGGFLLLTVFGEGFHTLGQTVPVVKTYLGGSVIAILGGAVLRASGVLPPETVALLDRFVNREGFLVFYIASLIAGSLFHIDRRLLLHATIRILPTAVISIFAGTVVIVLLCTAAGQTPLEGLLYVAVPMTSGGMTAGAVPLSAMYAEALSGDAGEILTKIAPATVLGNMVSILLGALGNRLGKRLPSLSGNGQLVSGGASPETGPKPKQKGARLGAGLLIALAFYQLAAIGNGALPLIPAYAWMILLLILAKSTGIVPQQMEEAATAWGDFVIQSWTAAALTGIGITLLDLRTIAGGLTPFYLFTIVAGVVTITVTAGFVGSRFMGFYPLESAIAAGMCTTNMGGSGNVAVLSGAERLELLPFAQIVTRTCGALMLTIGGILIHLLT